MRLRNIPGADEIVSASAYCIDDPENWKGCWNKLFENDHPIHMEIGMGKGRFIMDLARENPDINYIGVERYTSVLLRAVQKMDADPLPNIRFLCIDAADLPEYFEKEEVARIYLNFSDPWPKDRHAKRRLTSKEFLARYQQILAEDGRIEFKTDNQDLFQFSVDTIEESEDWKLDAKTYDLHHDEKMNQGNIMTEYEEKFSSKGNPICKLIASRLLCFLLILTTVFGVMYTTAIPVLAEEYWPTGVSVDSGSAVVMEVNTGTVLYEKNGDEIRYPASITKIMTALLVLENCELDEVVTFSADCIYATEGNGGSHIARDIGEEMTVEQCLYAMMLVSANECAYALAEHVGTKLGGNYETFIGMMNDKAKELGCKNTHFMNSYGMHDAEHYTTASDYALISAAAYRNEDFQIICGTKTYVIPTTNKHDDVYYCHNQNNLLYPYKYSDYLYDYCTGGKTGYTDYAHHTLVTYAEKDGMTLVCVILYSVAPAQWEDSINLYDYCFDNFQVFNISENESRLSEAKDKYYGLLNEEETYLTFDTDAYLILPKTASFSDAEFSMTEDDNGAQIIYQYDGRQVGYVSLEASDASVDEFPLTETEEETDPDVKVVKINLWYVFLIIIIIVAVFFGVKYGARLIKNYYIIRHKYETKRQERERFKQIRKKKRRRRKKDRLFR
ncbi:MAG: tRNA (guanosine(46)-N7)-methyltransferase TrmB [Lachnospiraceae bacterium]|nr:tRNA (guanosine(46)-N7)-methyltransferase TrmB [Lachnospiraceae bacterium]